MTTLRTGSNGDDVVQLQARLAELGFLSGKADGDFGPATEAALIAFQKSKGLQADGIAGPNTLAALGITASTAVPLAIPEVTVNKVCTMFPQTPRFNIATNLPFVLTGLVNANLNDKPMVLMALATIRAETEGFVPISEGQSRYNTSPGGQPFDLYDKRADLGNSQPGDGAKYKGRGFVQLTGKSNYLQHGQLIGLGARLVEQPDLANDPDTAAALLASFLKVKENPIKNALLAGDFGAARRLVNGGSNGLDRFEDCYQKGDAVLAVF